MTYTHLTPPTKAAARRDLLRQVVRDPVEATHSARLDRSCAP